MDNLTSKNSQAHLHANVLDPKVTIDPGLNFVSSSRRRKKSVNPSGANNNLGAELNENILGLSEQDVISRYSGSVYNN